MIPCGIVSTLRALSLAYCHQNSTTTTTSAISVSACLLSLCRTLPLMFAKNTSTQSYKSVYIGLGIGLCQCERTIRVPLYYSESDFFSWSLWLSNVNIQDSPWTYREQSRCRFNTKEPHIHHHFHSGAAGCWEIIPPEYNDYTSVMLHCFRDDTVEVLLTFLMESLLFW